MTYIGDIFYSTINNIYYEDHYLSVSNRFLGIDGDKNIITIIKYNEHKKLEI
jgi:hypothetical protein